MQPKSLGRGKPCPKCEKPMQRCGHKDAWKPRPDQPYYFAYWDHCRRCRHIQHYEAAKRYLGSSAVRQIDPRDWTGTPP